MSLPIRFSKWQTSARPVRAAASAFACRSCHGQNGQRADRPTLAIRPGEDVIPSPILWPGPLKVRPPFPLGPATLTQRSPARGSADRMPATRLSRGFGFLNAVGALSWVQTTTLRGSHPCAHPLSSSPFCPPRLPAACKPRQSAAWPALSPAWPWPMPWTKTWLQARRLAPWPVRPPAASNWACRPANPTDLTAFGRPPSFVIGPSGQHARMALFVFASRPGRAEGGERCSRRS
ncbi:MAG: hypothetical protein RIT14_205 [Pseudomonadota bacterium]